MKLDNDFYLYACPECKMVKDVPGWLQKHGDDHWCDHEGRFGLFLEGHKGWTKMVPFEEIYTPKREIVAASTRVEELEWLAQEVGMYAIDDPQLGSSAKMIPRGIWDLARKLMR